MAAWAKLGPVSRTPDNLSGPISQELETVQQEELRFLCDGLIPKTTTKALTIFRALEHAGRISWEDVCFLKESLNLVKRLDLVERLTAFEIKRNLTLLLGLYGRKRKKSEASSRFSSSVEKISEYLVKLPTETMKDRIDCNCIRSLMESRKGIKEVLVKFEDEIERELSFAWSKLTLLVVIAGEMISEALTNDGSRQKLDVKELYSSAAYELCSRMIKLGSWEDFCNHVEERYNSVYHHPSRSASDSSLLLKKEIADVVQKFKETPFFM